MLPHVAEILEAARLAPSRDNAQPWRFVVDGETVSFTVDAERARSPLDPKERLARMAVGASLENALVRAARMGAAVRFQETRPGALATVTFTGPKRVPELDKGIARRATNRHEYDGRAADDATFTLLKDAAPALGSVRAHWFGRERVRVLAPIVEDAETLLYGNASTRAALLGAIRFDARDREEVAHGVSIGSLELSGSERITLDEMRRGATDGPMSGNAWKRLPARTRKIVESASGICVIAASGEDPQVDFDVGRTMQRAWLAMARSGIVAHPLSAIASIESILTTDGATTFTALETERATAIRDALRAAIPNVDKEARVALILRFGWTSSTATKVGRRPAVESVNELEKQADPAPASDAEKKETTE